MHFKISKLLDFLEEDLGEGDITTSSIIAKNRKAVATVKAKESGILSGLEEVIGLFDYFGLEYKTSFFDGRKLKKGDTILEISGNAGELLKIERLILNILMRMGGIATATRRLQDICDPYGVRIAGTRKTTPGFRYFEKKAISAGGGDPHRFRLDDCILIKENHTALVGIEEAIKRAKSSYFTKKVEVEVSTKEEALRACEAGADIVMFDNFPVDMAKDTLSSINEKGYKVLIEISGGVTPENIGQYASMRPDIISMGFLTTGSRWLDMGMYIKLQD